MTAHYKEHDWGSRSFYTSLGHDVSNFTSNETFELLLKNALYWCASPSFPADLNELNNTSLAVYPNPFMNSINVNMDFDGACQVVVIDALIRVVYSTEIEKETTLDLSHLKKGVYYLVLNDQKNVYSRKIVKN